jgi:hypothetical protein
MKTILIICLVVIGSLTIWMIWKTGLLPRSYDQHAAIKFGITSAQYQPKAAETLIRYSAVKEWPNDFSLRQRYVDDALAGYRAERKLH